MKTRKMLALALAFVLSFALVACNGTSQNLSQTPSTLPAGIDELPSNTNLSDEQVFATFQGLAEKGKNVIYWYFGDVYDGNDAGLAIEVDDNSNAPYSQVGMFSTIAEMKEATEEIFTQTFCDALLYERAFVDASGGDMPLYKEIDGVLYRNINGGGFGWSYELTGEYKITQQTEDIISLSVKCVGYDEDFWSECRMKNENGNWKLEKLYDYVSTGENEVEISYRDEISSSESTSIPDNETLQKMFIDPLGVTSLIGSSWASPEEIDPDDVLVTFEIKVLNDSTAEEYFGDGGNFNFPCEVAEEYAEQYFGMSQEMLRMAEAYDSESQKYVVTAGLGGGLDIDITGGNRNGNRLEILYISVDVEGVSDENGILTVQINSDGSHQYLSNILSPVES